MAPSIDIRSQTWAWEGQDVELAWAHVRCGPRSRSTASRLSTTSTSTTLADRRQWMPPHVRADLHSQSFVEEFQRRTWTLVDTVNSSIARASTERMDKATKLDASGPPPTSICAMSGSQVLLGAERLRSATVDSPRSDDDGTDPTRRRP